MNIFSNTIKTIILMAATLLLSANMFAQEEIPTYPNYNTNPLPPDKTGMESNAWELAQKMGLGWNIGNTLDAIGGENAWSNPNITKDVIDELKRRGFNNIRIPCSWDQYLENQETVKIKDSWMKRVTEVVDYCIDNDMYVMLNIHWDGGWLENHIHEEEKLPIAAKQTALWHQIATNFRDYDEHLIFAGTNEPAVHDSADQAVLLFYLQNFVDAVRSTGGRNAYRVLISQGPTTDMEKTYRWMTELPKDKVPDRQMVEVHYYTPFQFCGLLEDASWGRMTYYWGKEYLSDTDTLRNPVWGEEDAAIKYFGMMKEKFIDKGIPVVLGEYGCCRRIMLEPDKVEKNLDSRAYWVRYMTKLAVETGLVPVYWDEGSIKNHGMGFMNRHTGEVADYQLLNAILQGYKDGQAQK